MTQANAGHLDDSAKPGRQRVSLLIHDLRHSLYALRVGLGLLKSRCREPGAVELCNTLADEERQAAELLDELVALVRDESDAA